ncbi:MAG: hypothetical protein QM760_20165 [Nibricoccus sp.]
MTKHRQLIVAKSDEAFWRFMDDTFLEPKFLSSRDSEEFRAREEALERRVSEYFPAIDLLVADPVFDVHEPQCVYSRSVLIAPPQLSTQLIQHMCGLLEGVFLDFRLMLHFQDESSDFGAVACFHSKMIVHPTLWTYVKKAPAFFACEEALVVDADSNGYRNLNEEEA